MTTQEHKHQLEAANKRSADLRKGRTALKAKIKELPGVDGRNMLAGILVDHGSGLTSDALEFLENVRIFDVLQWPKRTQYHPLVRMLRRRRLFRVHQSHTLTVGQLTYHEALELAAGLRTWTEPNARF